MMRDLYIIAREMCGSEFHSDGPDSMVTVSRCTMCAYIQSRLRELRDEWRADGEAVGRCEAYARAATMAREIGETGLAEKLAEMSKRWTPPNMGKPSGWDVENIPPRRVPIP